MLRALDAKFHLIFTATLRSVHHPHFVDQAYEAGEDTNVLKGTELGSVEPGRTPTWACLSSLCL